MLIDEVRFDADGLVAVAITDANTNELLTIAYANREALERTLRDRTTWLYSRSRKTLWNKGETSGNTQRVLGVRLDCDGDAVQYLVEPAGPACHTGEASCFHRDLLEKDDAESFAAFARAVAHLSRVLDERKSAPVDDSYVAKLYAGGVDKIGKKIGEEATEVVIAAKNASADELVWESSDLLFHLLVLLKHMNVPLDAVGRHLLGRAKPAP